MMFYLVLLVQMVFAERPGWRKYAVDTCTISRTPFKNHFCRLQTK